MDEFHTLQDLSHDPNLAAATTVPDNAIKPICSAIGYLVFHWGYVESAANICISAAYTYKGMASFEKEIPRAWSRRVRFLRKCLTLPELSHLSRSGIDILDRAVPLSNIRDFLVHGTLREFNPGVDPQLVFSKLDKDTTKQRHEESYFSITAINLAESANLCCDLAADFLKLAKGFQEALMHK